MDFSLEERERVEGTQSDREAGDNDQGNSEDYGDMGENGKKTGVVAGRRITGQKCGRDTRSRYQLVIGCTVG